MTAQVPESVIFEDREFDLCGLKGEDPFKPEAHGLSPKPLHTACWRGFVCTFAVRDERLVLEELEVGLRSWGPDDGGDSESPPIAGVEAQRNEKQGTAFYRSMSLPLEFTGRILIGRDFIGALYVHMGFQKACTYREVVELVFEGGQLVESRNMSDAMKEIRLRLEDHGGRPTEDLIQWIEERFSLDY